MEREDEDKTDWEANDELGFVFWCVEKQRPEDRPRRRR